jgi:type I restriction enzyme, S subunit
MSEASWSYVPAREVFSLSSGLPYAQAGPDPTGHVPIYGSSGFAGYGKKALASGATVVIGRVGEGGVGSVHYVEGEAWVTDNALWTDHINSRWLPQFVATYLSWSDLRRFRSQTGQPLITQKIIGSVPIPEPPLAEQRRIAEILDSADGQIRYAESVLRKEKILQDAMAHDIFKNPSGKELSLDEISSPERGSMTIGLFGSNLVAVDYRDSGVPVIFVQDIQSGSYRNVSKVHVSPAKAGQLNAHSARSGDLLLTKMGLPPCVAAVYPTGSPDAIITADIIRIRANTKIANADWLTYAINHERFRRQVRGITGGVTRPKVTLGDVCSLKITIPPLGEQQAAIAALGSAHNRRVAAEETLAKMRQLKQGLMDDLLTERVRVTALHLDVELAVRRDVVGRGKDFVEVVVEFFRGAEGLAAGAPIPGSLSCSSLSCRQRQQFTPDRLDV